MVTATLGKWLMTLMSSCQTRNYGCEGNLSWRHSSTFGFEPLALTIMPWFVWTWEHRVPFLWFGPFCLKISTTLMLRTTRSIYLLFGNHEKIMQKLYSSCWFSFSKGIGKQIHFYKFLLNSNKQLIIMYILIAYILITLYFALHYFDPF